MNARFEVARLAEITRLAVRADGRGATRVTTRVGSVRSATFIAVAALFATLFATDASFAADPKVEPVSVNAVAYFDTAKASLRPVDQPTILADVAKMQNVTWQSVTATGHTDSTGSAKLNARLAAQRARAVKSYLVGKGLDGSMIHAVGRASDAPVADNDSSDGRAKNRRTEIVFQGVRAVP